MTDALALPWPFAPVETGSGKVVQMIAAILIFVAVMGLILFLASLARGRNGDRAVGYLYLLPTLLMLLVGLVYPGLRTVWQSFFDAAGNAFIGLDNYATIFSDAEQLTVLRN